MRTILQFLFNILAVLAFSPCFAQPNSAAIHLEIDDSHQLRSTLFPTQTVSPITICGLIPSETYRFQVKQHEGSMNLIHTTDDLAGATQRLDFKSTAVCQVFYLFSSYPNNTAGLAAPLLSIRKEGSTNSFANELVQNMVGVNATPNTSYQSLVQDIFIGGGCFDVSGVVGNSGTNGIGTFDNGMSSVGFQNGVILSTGNVSLAAGPNALANSGTANGGGTDADLIATSGNFIADASILEFDFTPTIDQVTFEYVFASEEYCGFVGSINDIFGFFISGPGINGTFANNAINIATLPDGTNVSINNVNTAANAGFFVPNEVTTDNGNTCPGGPPGTTDIEYDGYTVALTAVANVIPCETYHIKLVIGDGFDDVYDSAVFLKANSFDAGSTGGAEALVDATGTNVAYESNTGCGQGSFIFTRNGGNINDPVVINFTIGGSATPGADYANLPTTITIPPGQVQFILPVNVFTDAIAEGTENIILSLETACSCSTNTAELFIEELPPLEVSLDDAEICAGTPAMFLAEPTGGVAPYTYMWSNGSPQPNLIDVPAQNTTYSLTVTDNCGTQTIETVNANVFEIEAILDGQASLCDGNSASLTVTFTGSDGPFNIGYIGPNGPVQIDDIPGPTYDLVIDAPGDYDLEYVATSNCIGNALGSVTVTGSDLSVVPSQTDVECAFASNGSIDLTVSGGTAPITYNWSNGATSEDIGGLVADIYTVTVLDGTGCESILDFTINEPQAIDVTEDFVVGVDCDTPTGGEININVLGGSGNFTFLWNNGETTQNITGLSSGFYDVTVFDGSCEQELLGIEVPGSTDVPEAIFLPASTIDCNNMTVFLDASPSSQGNYEYTWEATNGGSFVNPPVGLNAEAATEGTYTLTVTSLDNGCFASAPITIVADMAAPNADAGSDMTLDCNNMTLQLNGSNSDNGANITYAWAGPGTITDETTTQPSVDTDGTYTLTVTNSDNGCSSTNDVIVDMNMTAPDIMVEPTATLDCGVTSLDLNGTGSSEGADFSYQWTAITGNIQTGGQSLEPTINEAGEYELVVTNDITGCTSMATVTVADNGAQPVIMIADPDLMTCAVDNVLLDATGSDEGANFEYEWTVASGAGSIADPTALMTNVTGTGSYQLVITNTDNDCSSTLQIDVDEDIAAPAANIDPADEISCGDPTVALDGTNSAQGANITYEWTIIGTDGVIDTAIDGDQITVSAPGTYQLLVTNNDNGCAASAQMEVVGDPDTPVAAVSSNANLDCNTLETTISGNGSSIGANFTYTWTLDGVELTETGLFLTDQTEAGIYNLLVFNTNNDCEAEAFVEIMVDTLAPTPSIALPSEISCDDPTVTIDATNSPQGANFTYEWTIVSATGAIDSDINTTELTVSAPGTYQIEITNTDNGCTATDEVDITGDPAAPVAIVVSDGNIDCDATSVNIDAAGSSVGANFTYTWTLDGNDLGISDLQLNNQAEAGIYNLLVYNTNNDCEAEAFVEITVDTIAPTLILATPNELNCIVSNQNLDATASSQGADFDFTWTPTNGGNIVGNSDVLDPQINSAGTYTLQITNTVNGCVSVDEVTVTEDIDAPIVSIDTPNEITCAASEVALVGNGSGGANLTYTWTAINGGNISAGATMPTATANQAGGYELTVLNTDNNCETTEVINVIDNSVYPTADAGLDATLNCFNPTLPLSAANSSGQGTLSYQWSSVGGTFDSATDIAEPTISGDGTYQVIVTDINNECPDTAFVTIMADFVEPMVNAGLDDQLDCNVDNLSLAGAGDMGATYDLLWTASNGGNIESGETTDQPVINAAGTYTLTITNTVNGCSNSDDLDIGLDENAPIVSAVNTGDLTCTNMSSTITADLMNTGANFDFAWTIQDNIGNFSAGETTLQPTVDAAGTYILTVTNLDNNCATEYNVQIAENIVNPTIALTADQIITCDDEMVIVDGSGSDMGANFQVTWTTDADGNYVSGTDALMPTVDASGNYTLTILNTDNGCESTLTVPVLENTTPPNAMADAPAAITCTEMNAPLTSAGSSFGTNISYVWTNSTTGEEAGTSADITVSVSGDYQLVVTNTDNGCTAMATAFVDESTDFPAVEAGTATELDCIITSQILDGTGSEMGANITYLWEAIAGGFVESDETTLMPTINQPGTYQITVLNTDNNCESTDIVEVTANIVPPVIEIAQPAMITCIEDAVDLTASSPNNVTYVWSGPGTITNETTPTATVGQAGLFTVIATDTDNGCSETASMPVGENTDEPGAEAGQDYLINCDTGEATLTATSGTTNVSYEWSTADGTINSGANTANVNVGSATIYTLTVTDNDNGCTSTDDTEVMTESPTAFVADVTAPGCANDFGSIIVGDIEGGTPSYSYSIDGGETFTQSNIFNSLESGNYDVVIQDANGCEISEAYVVPQGEALLLEIEPTIDIAMGESIQLNPQLNNTDNIASISWTPADSLSCGDCLMPIATPAQTTTYHVIVRDSLGCSAEGRVTINVDRSPYIYVPTGFSPNGDGVNDIFYIHSREGNVLSIAAFQIYNRWGEQIFGYFDVQPNDPAYGWDGTFRGQAFNSGVFVWYAQVVMADGRIEFIKGDVTLTK